MKGLVLLGVIEGTQEFIDGVVDAITGTGEKIIEVSQDVLYQTILNALINFLEGVRNAITSIFPSSGDVVAFFRLSKTQLRTFSLISLIYTSGFGSLYIKEFLLSRSLEYSSEYISLPQLSSVSHYLRRFLSVLSSINSLKLGYSPYYHLNGGM